MGKRQVFKTIFFLAIHPCTRIATFTSCSWAILAVRSVLCESTNTSSTHGTDYGILLNCFPRFYRERIHWEGLWSSGHQIIGFWMVASLRGHEILAKKLVVLGFIETWRSASIEWKPSSSNSERTVDCLGGKDSMINSGFVWKYFYHLAKLQFHVLPHLFWSS